MADDDSVSLNPNDIETWTEKHEDDIIRLIQKSKIHKEYHREAGQYCKKWGHILELPPILFPIILAPISSTFDSYNWVVYMNMSGLIISGLAKTSNNGWTTAPDTISAARLKVSLKEI